MPLGQIVLHQSRRNSEPGGRSKKTPERIALIIEALENGLTKQAACGLARISLDTLANWLDGDDEFAEDVEIAMNRGEAVLLGRVVTAAEDPRYWTAAAWTLERTRQQRFALRTKAANDEVQGLPLALAEEIRRRMSEQPAAPAISEPVQDFVEASVVEDD